MTAAFAADLKPNTLQGFKDYVQATEDLRRQECARSNAFLYINALPKQQRDATWKSLLRGQTFVKHMQTPGPAGQSMQVPDGLVHDWIGAILIPGATLDQVLSVVRDYNDYQDIYRPEIVQSRLLSHEDGHYEVRLRMYKKSIVTVTYDIVSEVQFERPSATEAASTSTFSPIVEVDDAGTPKEHEEPFGHDSGYLWGVRSYWKWEQVKEGVIAEWEFISLSRNIPFLFAWLVKPLVANIARDTMQDTLTATRTAVLKEIKAGSIP